MDSNQCNSQVSTQIKIQLQLLSTTINSIPNKCHFDSTSKRANKPQYPINFSIAPVTWLLWVPGLSPRLKLMIAQRASRHFQLTRNHLNITTIYSIRSVKQRQLHTNRDATRPRQYSRQPYIAPETFKHPIKSHHVLRPVAKPNTHVFCRYRTFDFNDNQTNKFLL